MTFTTKYNTGDRLWFIDKGKIYHLKVEGIEAWHKEFGIGSLKDVVLYNFFEEGKDENGWPISHSIFEGELYTTKNELLQAMYNTK